jgi:hypothetical protein
MNPTIEEQDEEAARTIPPPGNFGAVAVYAQALIVTTAPESADDPILVVRALRTAADCLEAANVLPKLEGRALDAYFATCAADEIKSHATLMEREGATLRRIP